MENNVKSYPKYSVLMSVYYKEQAEFLDYSIKSMINQTIPPDEFVIVEDGPLTKELNDIIDSYQNKFEELFNIIKIPVNGGLGLALQKGVLKCKNELIARMDSDDYSFPDRMEKELEIFDEHPEFGLVGTNVNEFKENIEQVICQVVLPESQEEIYEFSKKRCPFRHPTLLYKKSEVLKAGNYREFYLCEDYDLYVRMLTNGCQCFNIQEPLVYMRIGSDFYKRRGGWKYMMAVLHFKNEQLKSGFFNFYDYFKSTIPHILVCLMPNKLRDYTYKNFLRKRCK